LNRFRLSLEVILTDDFSPFEKAIFGDADGEFVKTNFAICLPKDPPSFGAQAYDFPAKLRGFSKRL
jgi:hypothetical protein